MIKKGQKFCPKCGGELRKYDKVERIIRTKNRDSKKVYLRRMQCRNCHSVHRVLRPDMLPFKQYEKEIILGVIEGLITPYVLGFEDYPCEMTMVRWCSQIIQLP